jgi:hypothetical protein
MLVDLMRGVRAATDMLRELELEAARQARARDVPLRALASATGMAERSAASRYKSPSVELARTDDGTALIADEAALLPVLDLLRHAVLAAVPLLTAGAAASPNYGQSASTPTSSTRRCSCWPRRGTP